jgi:hypothetical protein
MLDLLTPAVTIAGGLVVFGATQLAQRFALDPVTDLVKALGRAAFVVTYYEHVYCNPGVDGPWEEAKKERERPRLNWRPPCGLCVSMGFSVC